MLSIRAITRSIPRAVSRCSAPAVRRVSPALRQTSLLQSSWTRASTPRLAAAFSTSRIRPEKQGEVDEELVAKFESELQMEKEMRDSDDVPVNVKDYLDNGPFEIEDVPGKEEVVLTRQFGDEHIRIVFSVADLNSLDADADRFDERALEDEEDENVDDPSERGPIPANSAQSGGAQSKSTVNAGQTSDGNIAAAPEDSIAPADRPELSDEETAAEDEGEDEQEPSFPARVTVTITKPSTGPGALQLETVAQDGVIVIDNAYYFAEASLATADEGTPERKAAYAGPPFGNLDEDLQVLLERYLDERGVNTALALFVPDYIDYKEQREYLGWLENVRSFVEA
ncbi:MAG: hypothetical protein M1832_003488 [Thelocarpon impressellum]|nr:MAG: hypothetical protein M1832_003488 [Thelocarpon impressellum]